MKRKYTCDRSITVTRLEDLLQDAAVKSTLFNIFHLVFQCFLTEDLIISSTG